MSAALPGQHYCKAHQGNHSHYDPQNCTVCVLLTALRDAYAHVTLLASGQKPVDSNAEMSERLYEAITKATEG